MHNFTESYESGNWIVKISPTTAYGYFEHNLTGEGGGLWFVERSLTYHVDNRELIDYDGVFELPKEVIAALSGAGYDVSYVTEE